MRIVYDDSKFDNLAECFNKMMMDMRTTYAELTEMKYGSARASWSKYKAAIEKTLKANGFELWGNAYHAHGIGNNNEWEIICTQGDEYQICGKIYLTHGMYGDVYGGVKPLRGNVKHKFEATGRVFKILN